MLRNIIHLGVGLLIGSVIGFFVANLMVEAPHTQLSGQATEKESRGNAATSDKGDAPLTNQEIRQAISKADQEPANLKLQKELGTGLLRYAALTGDTSYLSDIARLLSRVQEKSPQDSEALTALGDVELIRSQAGDKNRLKSAEAYYRKSLAIKGEDITPRLNLAIVYMNIEPPSYSRARAEFERVLKNDATNERALQGAALASIRSGDENGARHFIEVLKNSHPDSDSVRQLEAEIAKSGSSSNGNKF